MYHHGDLCEYGNSLLPSNAINKYRYHMGLLIVVKKLWFSKVICIWDIIYWTIKIRELPKRTTATWCHLLSPPSIFVMYKIIEWRQEDANKMSSHEYGKQPLMLDIN